MIKIFATLLFVIGQISPALAQASGTRNGNANLGSGNGNGNGNGNVSTTVNGARITPSVVAPGLAASGIESCLGSASVGASSGGFGLTVGSTTLDRGCDIRLYSRTLYAMGHPTAALQMLCNDPDVARALSSEGIICAPHLAIASGSTQDDTTQNRPTCKTYDVFRGCLDR